MNVVCAVLQTAFCACRHKRKRREPPAEKDMAGLDEKFSSMIGAQMDIRDKLKPIARRLTTLKKHIEQADIYMRYKGRKSLTEAEQIRKSVYSILRQEQRERQPHRTQDMEH